MQNKQDIHIALCFDLNYIYFMLATVFSVLDNLSQEKKLNLHLLHQNLDNDKLNFILEKLNKYDNVKVFFYPESDLNLPQIKNNRYGMAALYRLILPKVLSGKVKKIIYLDSDLMVFSDISNLWNVDLSNNIVAAVVNLSNKPSMEVNLKPCDYFNSGVLVINLEEWNKNNVSQLVINEINKSNYRYLDQAALNLVLKDKWLKLPIRWNMESDIFAYKNKTKSHVFHSNDSISMALKKPGIIHFTGPRKPWHYYSFHPYKNKYRNMIKNHFSNYDFLDQDKSLKLRFKKFFEFKRKFKQKLNSPNN